MGNFGLGRVVILYYNYSVEKYIRIGVLVEIRGRVNGGR